MTKVVPSTSDIVLLIQACGRELADQEHLQTGDLQPDSILFGPGGVLDSLGLVSLVLGLEEALDDQYGVLVTLADERAMSQHRSPFRSVQALADYAAELIRESS